MALNGQTNTAAEWSLLDKSGQRRFLAPDGLSAYDPTATLAVHCGNDFYAGSSHYQSTHLNRYDAVS
jgi:hypothetical protein